MAVTATFKHGSPVMVDYTPSGGDLTEGAVVVQGTVTGNTAGYGVIAGITHRPISNNAKGALAMGGGVYSVTNLNNAATGALVYWNGTDKVTTVSTNNAQFGVIVGSGGGGANSTCLVLHDPVPAFDDA